MTIPDTLPPVLPGESHTAYRRRVVPGYGEWHELAKRWRSYRVNRTKGITDPVELDTALDAVWELWYQDSPEACSRYAEICGTIPWIDFTPDGEPYDSGRMAC